MTDYIIAEPCHEDWARMTPREQGRHCAHCDKVVVDLTVLAPERAQSLLDEAKARSGAGPGESIGVCVRGHARPLPPTRTKAGHVLTGGMAVLLAFGGAGCAETPPPGEPSVAPGPVERVMGDVSGPTEPVTAAGGIEVAPPPVESAPTPTMQGEVSCPSPAPVVTPLTTVKELATHRGWTLVGEWTNAAGEGVPQVVRLRAPPAGAVCEPATGPAGTPVLIRRQRPDLSPLAAGKNFATAAEAQAWIDGVEDVQGFTPAAPQVADPDQGMEMGKVVMGIMAIPNQQDLENHRGWTLVGEWPHTDRQRAGAPQAVVLRGMAAAVDCVPVPAGRYRSSALAPLAYGKRFAAVAEARAWIDGVEDARVAMPAR